MNIDAGGVYLIGFILSIDRSSTLAIGSNVFEKIEEVEVIIQTRGAFASHCAHGCVEFPIGQKRAAGFSRSRLLKCLRERAAIRSCTLLNEVVGICGVHQKHTKIAIEEKYKQNTAEWGEPERDT